MRLNSIKLGMLTQAALASSLCLMPMVAMSAEIALNADGPIANGQSVWFAAKNVIGLVDPGAVLPAEMAGAKNILEGYSAQAQVDGYGTLLFSGSGTVSGKIGLAAGNKVNELRFSKAATTVELKGDTYLLGNINFLNNPGSILKLSPQVSGTPLIISAADILSSVTNQGAILFQDAMGLDVQVNIVGPIGSGVNKPTAVTVGSGVGNIIAHLGKSSNIGATNTYTLHDKATLELGDTLMLTGLVEGKVDGVGKLKVNSAGKIVSISNTVGATNGLALIDVAAGSANFRSNIKATNLIIAAGGTLQMDTGKNITGIINGAGTLDFKGGSNVLGVVGATTALGLIKINSFTAGTQTVDFQGGNVTATAIQVIGKGLVDDATLKFSTNNSVVTVADGITNIRNGLNIVDFDATTKMTGNVGAPGIVFKQIKTLANNNMQLNGSVWAGDLSLNGAFELTVSDNSNINAPVSATGIGNGTLTFVGNSVTGGDIGVPATKLAAVNTGVAGTLTVGHDISAIAINLKGVSTLKVNANNKTFTGDLNTLGTGSTLDLGANQLNLTGNLTIGANDILAIDITDAKNHGKLSVDGNATTNAASKLKISNNAALAYIQSKAIDIVTQTGGGALAEILPANIIEEDSTAMLSFSTQVDVLGKILRLVVIRKGVNNAAFDLSPQAQGVANVLEPAFLAGQFLDINQLVQNMDTNADVKTAMETLVAIDGSAAVNAAVLGSDIRMDFVQKRIEIARSGTVNYNTGMSAGDSTDGVGLWAQLLGSDFTQKKRDNILGYKGNNIGVMFGADTQLDSEWLVGVTFGYGNTDVNYDLAGNTTQVDSWQAIAYGSWDFNSPWFAEGMVGYTHHSFDQRRNIILAAQNRTAIADYNAAEWMMAARVGYELTINEFMLTPAASLRYANLSIDDYIETNAGTANLQVKNKDADVFVAGLGLKAEYKIGAFLPNIHFGMYYDFSAKAQETNSAFTGTTVGFMTNGAKPAHDSYKMGVGLNVHATNSFLLNLNYDYDFKSDFHMHAGYLKLEYQW